MQEYVQGETLVLTAREACVTSTVSLFNPLLLSFCSWRSQPVFCASSSDLDSKEDVDTNCDRLSGFSSSPPKR